MPYSQLFLQVYHTDEKKARRNEKYFAAICSFLARCIILRRIPFVLLLRGALRRRSPGGPVLPLLHALADERNGIGIPARGEGRERFQQALGHLFDDLVDASLRLRLARSRLLAPCLFFLLQRFPDLRRLLFGTVFDLLHALLCGERHRGDFFADQFRARAHRLGEFVDLGKFLIEL